MEATSALDPTATPGCPTSFRDLAIVAVVHSTLSALFGVYVVLFVLAMWSMYRRHGLSYRRLRMVTILLFIDLLVHYICRSITFGETRQMTQPANEQRMVTIPIVFVGALTSTFAGFLCNGILAWRFYIVYGKHRLALYLPAVAIVMNALLGMSGDFQHMWFYHNTWLYTIGFKLRTLKINMAWGWFTFSINTILTGGIVGKIVHASRSADRLNIAHPYGGNPYRVALAAVIESALVIWVGLLLYEIAELAPTGYITTAWNIGYVMICIIPIFFGISQSLIIVHLGFAADRYERESRQVIGLSLRSDAIVRQGTDNSAIAIMVSRETMDDAEKGTVDISEANSSRFE
ncbi:hypothetical protein BDY19DRAFT_989487 [Irpex rosettiformis]|uniref:Uncharacterized protein n=1 Tax=Irpex rosettiformis TaxID=378272 RepID=A0ACB8UHW3_9APHY|nr:hypothetical protein BDY19DRAFT_989487 [Irpex rosettiformis]